MPLESVVDYARKYLEDAIIRNELAPGVRIKEEEIALKLGVSRPPIRQAFEILVSEGLISRRPRCGVFVTEITENDIWQIYTLKGAAYALAISLTIDNMTEEFSEKLEDILIAMEECVRRDPADLIQYQSLNELFHTGAILETVKHDRLKKLIASLNNETKRLSYMTLAHRDHLLSNCQFHRRIQDALRAKDKNVALSLCQEHILMGMERLQRLKR